MDYNSLMTLMGQKRQEIGQRYADLPNTEAKVRESIFGNDPVQNNLNSQEKTKIDELFSHDQAVSNQYKSAPEPGQILDPYIRELQLTNRYRGTAGDLTDIRQKKEQRKDVLGDALEKALKMLNYGLEAGKLELSGLQDEFDNKMKLDDFALRKAEKANGGADKRGQGATDEALAALQEAITAELSKNPNADKKSLVWKWVNANEPYFQSQGINATALWDVYHKTPGQAGSGSTNLNALLQGPLAPQKAAPKPSPLSKFLPNLK